MTARVVFGFLVVAALAALLWLRSESGGDLACRHVLLADSGSGAPVVGAEDLALDPAGGRLLLCGGDAGAGAAHL
jgi:hypothetical protein